MEIKISSKLSESEFCQISKIWDDEYPKTLVGRLNNLISESQNQHHYLAFEGSGIIIGWAMVFENKNQQRFSILVSGKHQNSGVGSQLIKTLKKHHSKLLGWVIDNNNSLKCDGNFYQSPLTFYLNREFNVVDGVRIDNEILKAVLISWENNN